jgi:hypothetical protein
VRGTRERLARLLDSPERRARRGNREHAAEVDRLLLEQCHPKQRAFVLDTSKEIAAVVGRGSGKTTGGRVRFLRVMRRIPRARCLYIATTRQQAEEFMWAPLKALNEKLELGAVFSESKLRMTLPNGSTLRLVGADDKREIEKYRGQPFHEVQIDEAASHTVLILEHLLERIIGPRLGDYDGTIVMYGTPGRILSGELYEATRPQSEIGHPHEDHGSRDDLGWSTHYWTLLDGVDAGIPAMIALWKRALQIKKARGWSDDHPIWRREFLGLWAADDTESVFRYRPHLDDGAAWNQWDPKRDPKRLGFAELPPGDWVYVYGMDMGHSDPFALGIYAFDQVSRELRHVYEFTQTGMFAKTIAELLVGKAWVKRILAGRDPGPAAGVIGVTDWPYGMVADTAGLGGAMLDELREVYGIPIDAAEKVHKHDNIELTNGDLIDGRIKILKKSVLEDQLLHLQWAVDPWGKLKEDKAARNDCTDTLIYARRKAMHLIAEDAPPPEPEHGTQAEIEQWLEDDEEKAAMPQNEYTDLLTDDNYADDW